MLHHKLPIVGYRMGDFVYFTDVKRIPEVEYQKLKGVQLLIINALRKEEHISHLSLSESLEVIEKVNPSVCYLTHFSHEMGLHAEFSNELPDNVFAAYDGLELSL